MILEILMGQSVMFWWGFVGVLLGYCSTKISFRRRNWLKLLLNPNESRTNQAVILLNTLASPDLIPTPLFKNSMVKFHKLP